jgi:DNA repair ATPase RecN
MNRLLGQGLFILGVCVALGACCKGKKDECGSLMIKVVSSNVEINEAINDKSNKLNDIATKIDDQADSLDKVSISDKKLKGLRDDYTSNLHNLSKYYKNLDGALKSLSDKAAFNAKFDQAKADRKKHESENNRLQRKFVKYCEDKKKE